VTPPHTPFGRHTLPGHGAILVTVLLWGSLIPFLNMLLAEFDAFTLSLLRYGIATAILASFVLLRRGSYILAVLPIRKALLLGAGGIAGFTTFYTLGIRFSDPGTAVVVNAATPIVSAVFAALIYRAPMEKGAGVALIIVALGGVVASIGRQSGGGLGFRGGELLFVAAAFCWAWYSINAQRWLGHLRQSELTAVTMMSACLALALVCLGAVALGEARWPIAMTTRLLGLIAFVGLGATLIGVMCWNFAVARLGIVVASLYLSLLPVVGIVTVAALGTPPSTLQLVGGVLVMTGIVQLHLRRIRRRRGAT
jgi:drug/metabolite transporter (DMT)-like permease